MKRTIIFILISVSSQALYSQKYLPDISVESGAIISTGKHSPFWFYSNQYGKISTKNNSIYLLPSIYKNLNDSNKFDFSYNISPLFRYDSSGKTYLHQWYGELKYQFMHFTAGAKEEFYGNQDSTLSTGFILWSKNARPMPKLTIGVPEYTPVPFTWNYLEFKGGLSHGWFDDNEYNKNVWLHHKYFYLRLGGKLPVHVSYGLHHFAQWGGTNYEPYGELPHNLEAYKNVFLGRSGNTADSNTPESEWANRLGNHIGSRNFGAEIDFRRTKVLLYWQNIFEDGSGKAYRNIKDGLFGISIRSKEKNKLISGFVYEFFNSTDQSGRTHETDSITPDGHYYQLGGNDDYFNNSVYIKGWTYRDIVIGTPLITSPSIFDETGEFTRIRNNKIIAHNFGFEGIYEKIKYRMNYLYSINYGTNSYPIFRKLHVVNFSINTYLKGFNLIYSFSYNFGNFLDKSLGLFLIIDITL